MKEEIAAAVFFTTRLVKRYGCLDNDHRERLLPPSPRFCLRIIRTIGIRVHLPKDRPTDGRFLSSPSGSRCLRMNRVQLQDPVLQQACEQSAVRYQDLGLPLEITVWVDPGEVSCSVGQSARRGIFRRIHDAVERASLDIQSGSSSDEEDEVMDKSMSSNSSLRSLSGPWPTTSLEAKTIPTVSNPNSVYRFSEFSPGAPQTWVREKRKGFPGDSFSSSTGCPPSQFSNQKGFKAYRAAFTFTGPRVDKYHWVCKSRS